MSYAPWESSSWVALWNGLKAQCICNREDTFFKLFSRVFHTPNSSATTQHRARRWRCVCVIYGGDVRRRERPLAESAEHRASSLPAERESRVVPRLELHLCAPSTEDSCYFSRWNHRWNLNWRVDVGKRRVWEVLHIILSTMIFMIIGAAIVMVRRLFRLHTHFPQF